MDEAAFKTSIILSLALGVSRTAIPQNSKRKLYTFALSSEIKAKVREIKAKVVYNSSCIQSRKLIIVIKVVSTQPARSD
jgi:uncharacterized protein YqfA (UPF0365 family)